MVDIRLLGGEVPGRPRLARRLFHRIGPRLLDFVIERLADLAKPWAEGFELLGQDRPDRVLDDVFDNRVGRVVRAARLALRLVVREIDFPFADHGLGHLATFRLHLAERDVFLLLLRLGREVLFGHLELELQQPFVDRAQVSNFERLIVDEDQGEGLFVGVAGQPVDGQRQVTVRHLVFGKEAGDSLFPRLGVVRASNEQSTVVDRHVERRVAPVHRRRETNDAVVECRLFDRVWLIA